jgi:hypothetical protein
MPPLNYTTSVPAARTIGEMQTLLARAGADAVAVRYDGKGGAVGLTFTLPGPSRNGTRAFSLPVDVAAVHKLLLTREAEGAFRASRKGRGSFSSPEHAQRVAWRVAKDWLEAQLAIIEAQMATLEQVMFPYMHDGEITLYQRYLENTAAAVEAPR